MYRRPSFVNKGKREKEKFYILIMRKMSVIVVNAIRGRLMSEKMYL